MFQWTGCKPRRSWLVRWFSEEEATAATAATAAAPKKATMDPVVKQAKIQLIEDLDGICSVYSDTGARYNLRPRRKVVVYTA